MTPAIAINVCSVTYLNLQEAESSKKGKKPRHSSLNYPAENKRRNGENVKNMTHSQTGECYKKQ